MTKRDKKYIQIGGIERPGDPQYHDRGIHNITLVKEDMSSNMVSHGVEDYRSVAELAGNLGFRLDCLLGRQSRRLLHNKEYFA